MESSNFHREKKFLLLKLNHCVCGFLGSIVAQSLSLIIAWHNFNRVVIKENRRESCTKMYFCYLCTHKKTQVNMTRKCPTLNGSNKETRNSCNNRTHRVTTVTWENYSEKNISSLEFLQMINSKYHKIKYPRNYKNHLYILCKINLAIILYGWANQHQIPSFIFVVMKIQAPIIWQEFPFKKYQTQRLC